MHPKTREDHHEAERQMALRSLERVKGRWWQTTEVMPGLYGSADADETEVYQYHARQRGPWYVGPLIFFAVLIAIFIGVLYLRSLI